MRRMRRDDFSFDKDAESRRSNVSRREMKLVLQNFQPSEYLEANSGLSACFKTGMCLAVGHRCCDALIPARRSDVVARMLQDQNFAALVLVNWASRQRCYTLNSYKRL